MSIYAVWNNKGGVGKSYLTFQIACEYAKQNPNKKVLVVDLCPQANVSSMLLGGLEAGEIELNKIHSKENKKTVSGYISEKLISPYKAIRAGFDYVTRVNQINKIIPENVYLVVGDEELEAQAAGVSYASNNPNVSEAWRVVHLWVLEMIRDIEHNWQKEELTVFIDCNPSFSIYTELALSAADRLIIPFTADGSSKRAVKSVLSLVYGVKRHKGDAPSFFAKEAKAYSLALPKIYLYVGNRLTTNSKVSAKAFKTVIQEIGEEIYSVWKSDSSLFQTHPKGEGTPTNQEEFKKMFQAEIRDANTASVVSSAKGIPIGELEYGIQNLLGEEVVVNQTQLDMQVPNMIELVKNIE